MVETTGPLVTLAVPCRRDEPSLDRTLAAALASWRETTRPALEIQVCLNGAGGDGPRDACAALARQEGARFLTVDLEAGTPRVLAPATGALSIVVLSTTRTGKAIAWNALRAHAHGQVAVFVDADVSFARDAVGRLLDALVAHPEAVLASAKTTCVARAGAFERIMAAPYRVDFPNLSAQLYAARVAALPRSMPEDLIEPERWLELELGRERLVRVPEVLVAVRLPGTLRDFFKQRVRIEMGKVQLAEVYPGLERRGATQPSVRAALGRLGAAESARLGAYVALRSVAHAWAWWRWRRGATAGIWRQAVTTKRWEAS